MALGYMQAVGMLATDLLTFLVSATSAKEMYLQVSAATLGLEEAAEKLPGWQADLSILHLLQGVALLSGLLSSIFLLNRLKPRSFRFLGPQSLLMSAFTAELWWLII